MLLLLLLNYKNHHFVGEKLHEELLSFNTCLELLVSVHQIDDTFNQTKDAWNTSPTKQDVNYAWHCVAHVELVDTETTNQDTEETCYHFIFHNSIVFLAVEKSF